MTDAQHEELGPSCNVSCCGYENIKAIYGMKYDAIVLCFKPNFTEQGVIDNQVFPTLTKEGLLIYKKVASK